MRELARWQFYFAKNGIEPLELWYEDVAASPAAAVERVARLVGIPAPPLPEPSRLTLRIQRDEVSEAWRARFLAESADLTAFH